MDLIFCTINNTTGWRSLKLKSLKSGSVGTDPYCLHHQGMFMHRVLSASIRHHVRFHELSRDFDPQPTRYLPPHACTRQHALARRRARNSCRLLHQLLQCQLPFGEALGPKHNSPLVMWTLNDRASG